MNRLIARAMCALIFLTALSIGRVNAEQQTGTADDSAAIKQVVARYADALNHNDAHATALIFTEDADFTDTTGTYFHGRKNIEAGLASLFKGTLRAAHRDDTVKSIRFLTPEIAAVDNDWIVTGLKAADGSDLPVRKGIHAWVMVKQNGQWLIAVFYGQNNH
jgi:uncharacterized protein (TIGR02246 family)